MHDKSEKLEAFGRLLDVLDTLRVKCPWDSQQTFDSIRPLTIEETFELSQAILKQDYADVCKEAGDLLLHIVFYSKFGEEQGLFDIKDVCDRVCEKLIYRHPHIYGNVKAETPRQVSDNWEALKLKEKNGNKTVLSGVPEVLPSVIKAYRMQDKARGVGFDWADASGAWEKVREEIGEVQAEMDKGDPEALEKEFGDLFFSLINVARLYKINPDNALEKTNEKFRNRFNYLEAQTIRQGKSLRDMTLEEMDAYWNEAKKLFP